MEVAAGGPDCGVKILKYLLGLGAEVVFADQITGSVQRDLACDVNYLPSRYLAYLRVTGHRLGHRVRIEEPKIRGFGHRSALCLLGRLHKRCGGKDRDAKKAPKQ